MESKVSLPCRCIAVISDIHSNYPAFRACYEDALAQGAEGFVFLGDFISDLADVRPTLELVYEIRRQYPTVCLRGNRERYMLEHKAGLFPFSPGSKTGSLLYTWEQLQPEDLSFFESLPTSCTVEIGGVTAEAAHAWRDDDRRHFTPESGMTEILEEMKHPYLLTGHCHQQYSYSQDGKTVVNPGSVGVPRGYGYWTQYALARVEDGQLRFTLRQLPYDLAAAVHSQFASGLTDIANCWAIGVLYDVITGEECALPLLERVREHVYDEALWRTAAAELGMCFTEEELQTLAQKERSNDPC